MSGALFATAGFPHLTEVVIVAGLAIICFFVWRLTARSHEQTPVPSVGGHHTNWIKSFGFVLLVAWPATGSLVVAAPPFEPEATCRAAIASIKDRDPKALKVALVRNGVFILTYTRPIDSFVWTYRCRIEGSRVVWADEPGRWRNDPKDDKISFEAIDAGAHLQIIATRRNGLTNKQVFDREKVL